MLLFGATLPDGTISLARQMPIPAGDFEMGCDQSDPQESCQPDELPLHTVYLDAYSIDQTEVTNAQYGKCVEAGACEASECANDSQYNQDQQPVVGVSWHDADAYCRWAGGRLPTEAEWKKAARGTGGRIYPWGNEEPDCSRANFGNCAPGPSAVGSYPAGASPYGVLDMAGNAWEWVADWCAGDYYCRSPAHNPPGPDSGGVRVLRGGSWYYDVDSLRAAIRGNSDPDNRNDTLGFRCAAAGPGE